MQDSKLPPGRISIPPASAEFIRNYIKQKFPPMPFANRKELAFFLASDSTKIFLTFVSSSLKGINSSSKGKGAKAVLRELDSRMPKHLNHIFAELSPEARKAVFALRKKIIHHSAKLIEGGAFPKTEKLEKAILLARFAGKNVESRGATPEEASCVVCGVFAASAKVFQSRKALAAHDFIKSTEKISCEMPASTLTSFLRKIAGSKNDAELSATAREVLRLGRNEEKILLLLSS